MTWSSNTVWVKNMAMQMGCPGFLKRKTSAIAMKLVYPYPHSHVKDVPFALKSTINRLSLKMVLMMSFPCPSILHPSLMISVQRKSSLLSSQVVREVTPIGYPSIPLTNYERPKSKTQTYPSLFIGLRLMRNPLSMMSTCVAWLLKSFGSTGLNLSARWGPLLSMGRQSC